MGFGLTKATSKHGGRIIEQWVFDAKAPLVSAATVADLYKDGRQQVVFGTKSGEVFCIDEDGKELWKYSPTSSLSTVESFFVDQERMHSVDAPPVIMDIDHDGKPEILVGSELGVLSCLSVEGKLLWKHDCGGAIKAGCVVNDINMDGRPEVLVGSSNNKLTILTNKGEKLFEYISDSPVDSVPGVLKTDKIMIVFGNDKGMLTAITSSQELIWKIDLRSKITAAPAFFRSDNEECMVIGTIDGIMYCISSKGEVLWSFKTKGSIYSAAAIADINDDQRQEVIFGSCDNNVNIRPRLRPRTL